MSDRVPGGAAMAHHHHHSGAGATLQPTFVGYISSTMDALVLFEACLTGHISHVPRRPHDRERANLIRSGNVFIYEEHSSGIKRWTDGVPWSPSRILGNFLLYRELDKPFQPGEKKRAMKKTANKDSNGVTKPASNSRANSVGFSGMNMSGLASQYTDAPGNNKEAERALVGSLVDSYQFKPDGLVKKTISVQYKGMQHHLVSYYNLDDVVNKKLRTPLESPELQHITPRAALISAGNFRAPVDDHELIMDDRMRLLIAQGQMMTPEMNPYTAGSRSMSVPNVHHGYHQAGWSTGYPMQANSLHLRGFFSDANAAAELPSMQMPPSRRHSTIANNGYDTNGSGHGSYGSMPSLGRSHLGSTPVVPSSGMPSSSMIDSHGMGHGSFSGQSMYDSPAASAASSQHGAMYDSSARHATSYESSSSQHQNTSYDTQANPMFDSTSTAQATGDYESALQSQQGLGSFESPSDDNTPSALNGMDLNSSVNSAELSDGGHYSSYSSHDTGYSARGPHSQSIP
ncbi:uncharacterized protein PG986_000800 [Apiospora aurea]|uniref:Uncharacterized protein n=1 Tax=Apiospora aurea TaxID=335848 RepID=A0ABR1QV55_9PEZI